MTKVSRLCRCGRIVVGKCECTEVAAANADDYRESFYQRYGLRWVKLSKRKRRANPLCERCEARGKTTLAVDVHHIQKVRDRPDLKYEWSNLMSVCRPCHALLDKAK